MPNYILLSFLAAVGFALAGVVNKKVYLIRTIGVILILFGALKISLGG